jgi:hypothetical protein
MFVDRTLGAFVGGACALLACSDPSLNTDLRPDGPPEVLSVLVYAPDHRAGYAGSFIETATFCKKGDDKRPNVVGTVDTSTTTVCPDDLSQDAPEVVDAAPSSWYVRIMFDELLDPNVEQLTDVVDADGNPTGTQQGSIAHTKPVTLQCESVAGGMVDIPYDGYYSPSGNALTWPVGPSLVVKPNHPELVATNSECQIKIKDSVHDEDSEPKTVPPSQRGPYTFKIAPIQVVAISPADGGAAVDPDVAGVDLTFNTAIDPASFTGSPNFTFTPDPGGDYTTGESAEEWFVGGDFAGASSYSFAFVAGTKI